MGAAESKATEGDISGMDEQYKEFFSCRICFDRFNETTRLPKFLSCHHSFCLQCLVLIQRPPRVECPLCRASTDLGGGSVANLATNHMALWILQKAGQEIPVKRDTQSRPKLFCLNCVCESQQCSTVGTHVFADLSEGIDILYNKIESKLQDFETNCEKALVDIKSCQSVYSSVRGAIFRIRSELQDFEDHFEKLRASVTANEREAALSRTRDLTDETSNVIERLFERLCNLKETKEEVARITTEAQATLRKIEAINQTKMTISLNCSRHSIGTLRFPPECRELPLSFNSEQNIPEYLRDFVPLFSYFVLKCATFVPSGSTAAATNDQQVDPSVTGGGASRPFVDDAGRESSPSSSTSPTKSGESGATSSSSSSLPAETGRPNRRPDCQKMFPSSVDTGTSSAASTSKMKPELPTLASEAVGPVVNSNYRMMDCEPESLFQKASVKELPTEPCPPQAAKAVPITTKEPMVTSRSRDTVAGSSGLSSDKFVPMTPETEALCKTVLSILNTLTPFNFDLSAKKLAVLPAFTEEQLSAIVNTFFEKVLTDDSPIQLPLYAKLCQQVNKKALCTSSPQESTTFRKLVLSRCQSEFEKDKDKTSFEEIKREEIAKAKSEKLRKTLEDELEELISKNRRRSVRNIRFIGELFKLRILSSRIMFTCMSRLVSHPDDEDSLECLCQLLSTVGCELDTAQTRQGIGLSIRPNPTFEMDSCFSSLSDIVNSGKLSSRIRFMIQDVIDLRANGWKPRSRDSPNSSHPTRQTAEYKPTEDDRSASSSSGSAPAAVKSRASVVPSIVTVAVNMSIDAGTYKFNKEKFRSRKGRLNSFIAGDPVCEQKALSSVQVVVRERNHPEGLMTSIFEALYEGSIISKEGFQTWKRNNPAEFASGSLTSFFMNLDQARTPN